MISRSNCSKREGVVAPLFAFILPVLLIFSAFAINLAYMQLTTTQLKIASDASSHAGGRALSFHQDTDLAIIEMDRYAQLNPVARTQIIIPQDDDHMQFGQAILADGKYEFVQHSKAVADSDDNGVIVNSVRVFAEVDTPLAFRFQMASGNFNPTRGSITHQRDRDIAMVLDQSISMIDFTNRPALDTILLDRLENNQISQEEYNFARGIGDDGKVRFHGRYYTNNTLNKMGQLADTYEADDHELAVTARQAVEYATSLQANLKSPKFDLDLTDSTFAGDAELEVAGEWRSRKNDGAFDSAPVHSRYEALIEAIDEFLTVLEHTDQDEQVALILFSSDAEAESILTSDYDLLREIVRETIPIGGTQIGEGLEAGLQEVVDYQGSGEPANSRRFAEKMIIVMTDGGQTADGLEAAPVAYEFKQEHPEAIIHTVTFGEIAEQEDMLEVAEAGGGNHYHADDADELAEEFREIANIPPTIFTY